MGASATGQTVATRVGQNVGAPEHRTQVAATSTPPLPVTLAASADAQSTVEAVWDGVQAEGAFLPTAGEVAAGREWSGPARRAPAASLAALGADDRAARVAACRARRRGHRTPTPSSGPWTSLGAWDRPRAGRRRPWWCGVRTGPNPGWSRASCGWSCRSRPERLTGRGASARPTTPTGPPSNGQPAACRRGDAMSQSARDARWLWAVALVAARRRIARCRRRRDWRASARCANRRRRRDERSPLTRLRRRLDDEARMQAALDTRAGCSSARLPAPRWASASRWPDEACGRARWRSRCRSSLRRSLVVIAPAGDGPRRPPPRRWSVVTARQPRRHRRGPRARRRASVARPRGRRGVGQGGGGAPAGATTGVDASGRGGGDDGGGHGSAGGGDPHRRHHRRAGLESDPARSGSPPCRCVSRRRRIWAVGRPKARHPRPSTSSPAARSCSGRDHVTGRADLARRHRGPSRAVPNGAAEIALPSPPGGTWLLTPGSGRAGDGARLLAVRVVDRCAADGARRRAGPRPPAGAAAGRICR